MRQKVKRYSRSAISILLTLCMIMSCMTVGIIATDAAKVSADEAVGANGFIKGSWDNWQQHDFTYEVSLPANTSYRFDVYKSSGQQCANDGVKISGTTQYTANNNNNGSMILETGAAGTYKFTYVSDDSGSMTFKVEFPSVTVSSVTAVGDSTALFGTAWAPTATANDMTNSGTTWSKTWTNVSLPAGTIQYKVALNHSWDITYPTDNNTQTVSSAGIYDVTVTYNSSNNAVNMTLTNKTPHKFQLATTEHAVVKASYNSTTIQEDGEFASVPQGETITVTVTPDVGYKIQSVNATNGGTVTGSGNTQTVTMPDADTKVTVTMVDVGKRTVYFNNNNTKYAMVTAKYTYNGETVTSTMTKLSNSNIWSIEVPSDLDEITFIGDNGYNTRSLTIPGTSTYEPPMYTAPFNAQAPTTANGGTWGKYNERGNVYTVSKGSTLNTTTNLFTGISATFYDYYTDGEISHGWIEGIGAKEYSRSDGSKYTWNPFSTLNSAISDYSSASKNNVGLPLYFGNLNVTSKESNNTLSIDTVGGGTSSTIKAYTGWNQDVNNSVNLKTDNVNDPNKSVTGLTGQTLAGSTIHYYKNGASNENGAPMAIFDEDFLSGLNTQNTALASILRSPAFPVRKTTKSDHAYYEFDSTNGTDNAYFTTIDKTNKTAVLDYYAASDNKTVESCTPEKGFFPFDYSNITNSNISQTYSPGYIYLNTAGISGGASYWAHAFKSTDGSSTDNYPMEQVGSTGIYKVHIPEWYDKVIFTRNSNTSAPYGTWGDENSSNVWNWSETLTVPHGSNSNLQFNANYQGDGKDNIRGNWVPYAAAPHMAHDLGFGAKLEIPFTLEAGGYFHDNNAAQVFEFSGDDDLWVFIDNKLVLDLGGAHSKAVGSINFKTETVSVTTNQQGANNPAAERNVSFASWFNNSNPNQPHTMTIYYLERGMYDSNLKFGFSFHPIPNQFTAEKKVRTANINGGFYTINNNTRSSSMTLDGGRAITQFEETYQNEDFEITHKVGDSLIGALDYTLTEKDDHEATGTKTSSMTVANGKYTIQNDDLATFVNNLTKNTTFNLTESFPASNKYKYTPSIEVYDDGHNKQLFTAVNTTPSAAGQVQKVDEGSYSFKFSETNPIAGMENLNIRARFINQMNSHDLTIKKETNDPTDTNTPFKLKVLFQFGSYEYTPYPLTCTLNGVDAVLGEDGSITVKNGDTIIIPKVPENANVRIIEELNDATSAYSYVGTDVKYSDGTTFDGTVTDSLTAKQVDFAIGTKDTTAIVNNHKCSLSTNHTLYASPIGSGNTYTTVTVKNADGGTVYTYPRTSGMITVDPLYIKASSTDKLEIVLETVPNSGYKFDEFYENITGTMKKLAASGTGYTAVFDPSGTKVTVTVLVSALFANNEQAYTLLPFYSKLSIPEKNLTINKTVDVAADGETSFDVKVEYFDGSDWVAYDDEGNVTDANGMGSVAANGSLTVTLKGVAAMNKVRVTEIPKAGTKYQAPIYALTSGGTEDTSYTGNGIAFTSTLEQNPVVGITNNIKRQNFTITKKIDVASNPAGTFTFMVNLNGSAIPDTYQYQIGNGTAQNFSGGTVPLTGVTADTTITVLNVPVGASIEVYESNSGTGYDLNNVVFTAGGSVGNAAVSANKHATFTVTDGTTHALEFTNYKKQTVTIKKELIARDTDVDDPATAFKFKIKVDGQDYKSRVKLDNADYDPVNGVYELKINQIMALSNIARGAVVNVVEVDHNNEYYEYDSTTVTGATKETATAIDGITDGAKFTVGSQPVEVVVKNKARRVDVVINKKTDFPVDDESEFVIDVKSRQRNSQNNDPVANSSGVVSSGSTNNGDGTYKLIKDGTITFTNVPKGTYFIVNETSQGTYSPINGARFTKQSIHAYPTSTASNPQYIQVRDDSQNLTDELTARSVPMTDNTTFVVSNIVKRNDLIIAKTITDATDHDTEHTLTVVLKQSESGAAYTDLTYQYKRHGDADWSTEQSFTSGGTIKIHQDEQIKFSNVPIGSYISILETSPNGNYTLDNINVTNYISGSLDKDSVTNQVSFLTADGTGATNVNITNKLQRFDLAVTKNTDSKVSDTFKVKVQTSDAQNGTYNDMVFTAAGQFTISGLTDEQAYSKYDTSTHEITLTKDQTLTVKNLAINSYVKVVETSPGAKHEWQNYTPATGTTIKNTVSSAADGAIVQMTADQALTINNKIKTQNVTIEKVVTNSSSDHAFPIHVKVQPKGSSDGITGTYKYKVGNGSEQTVSDASTTNGLALTIQQGTANKIQILDVPVGAQVIVEEDSLSSTNFTFEDIDSTNAGGTKNGQAYTFTVADGTDPTVTITNSIKTREVKIGKRVDTGSTAKTFPIKVEVTQTKGTFTMPEDFTNNVKSFTHGATNDVTLTVPLDATVTVTEANADIPAGFEFEKITLGGTDVSATGNSYTYTGTTSYTANKEILVHNTELHKLTVAKTVEGTDNTTDTFTFKAYKWDSSNSTWGNETEFTLTKGASHEVFTNVRKGEKFKVVEVVPDKYTYDTTAAKTKVEGATGSAAFTDATNKTYGFQNIVMGTADVNVTVNNIVKTKTVKISKTTNYTEAQNDGAFGFNVKTKADGAAAGTAFTNCTYKYKINGTGDEQTFNNGNFTLTNGQFITIENVPVDTQFEVEETNSLSATSTTETYTGLTADSNLTDKTAHFTVSTDDNQEVNFFNSRNKTLKIKKTKPAADSDINDTTTSFYISVRKYNTDTSAYVPYNGNVGTDYNATSGVTLANGVFTLKMGGEVTINVNDGEQYEVKEIDIDSKYTLSGVTGGDTDVMDGSNKVVGRSATIGTENVEITFTNQIKRHNVIVQKAYSSGDSNIAEHTVVVTVRPNGQSSDVGKTEYTETQFKKGTNYVVSNVPAGAYVTVQETACATGYVLDNISDAAFTMPPDADKTVIVTNKLDKYNLDIVKTVNDNVADTYTVKIYQSDDNSNWTEVKSGVKKGNDTVTYNNGFAIQKGNDNKLTLTDIDYGKYIKVEETNAGTKHHWTAYTGGTTNGATQDAGVITQVTATGQSVGITNAVNTHKVTITKALTNSNNNTAKFKISATVNGETSWSHKINGTVAANNSLTDMEITAGQTIELLDVPVDAVVNVSEPTDTTGFSFVSATYSITGSSTTGHNEDGQKNVTFTMDNYDATVTVNNKINDKIITVKKVTDSGDGSDFKVKVEYKLSNATSDTWTPYVNTTAGFGSDGVATFAHNDEKSVSIPSDAQVKVTEVIANMPSGYAFESITLNSDATTYDNGKVAAVADTNIITVHNTKLRNVNITKTTDVSTDTATEFKITVEKSTDGNTWSYVTTLKKGSDTVNASENKFVIKKGDTLTLEGVRKGTQIRVTETDTTDSYTFSASGSGVTDVNTAATINGDSKTIAFTVDKAADPTVTVDNDAVKKSFTIEKHVDVATDQNFTIRLRKKALGESTFTAYTGVGFNENGQKTIQAGSEHAITISAQPVGTEFILEEITGSNPTGYNFTSVTLTGLTAITPSETVTNGQAFKVSTETTQKAVVNNTKSSQLIVTKAITGDTANKQFPIVIQKQNGDAIDSSKISVQNASGAELTNRTADGKVFMLSAGDKVIVNGVTQGEKYFVKENALSGTDYLGYRFDNYAITPNGTSSEDSNSGKLITIGGESVTVTVNNSLITRNIQIKKTVDYAYSNETSFPISVQYYDTVSSTWKTVTGAPTEIQARDTWTTVTLTGQAAVSEIRVTENLPSATHYGTPTLTVADATKEDGDSSATAVAFNFDVTKTPQVTIANHAKTAKVNVTKQLVDGNTTSAFEINVAYKTPGADNFVTKTYSVVPGNTSADLVLPIGTIVKVTETADTVTGYELDSMQKKVGSAEATDYTEGTEYTLTTDNVLFTVKNKLKTYTVTVHKVIDNEPTNTTTPFKVNVNSEEKEIRQGTAHSFTAKYGDTVTVSETDLPRGYELVSITNGSTTTSAGINSLETAVTGNTTITVTNRKLPTYEVTIRKQAEGEPGDTTFGITVSGTADIPYSYEYSTSVTGTVDTASHEFNMKSGESVTLKGLLAGDQLTIEETNAGTDYSFEKFVVNNVDNANATITYTVKSDGNNIVVHNKPSAKYQYEIKYIYEGYTATTFNNDGSFKEGPQRFFIATGELTTDEWNEFVDTSKKNTLNAGKADNFITKTAPHEDDFMMNLQFKSSEIKNVVVDKVNKKVSFEVTATTTPERDVYVYFQLPYAVDENLVATGDTFIPYQQKDATTVYGHWVQKNGSFISAPLTLKDGSNTRYFQYWQIRSRTAESGRNKGKVETDYKRCYYADFNMTMYQDSYVTAVYTTAQTDYNPNAASYQDTKDGEAYINFIENSRNQWNSDGGGDGMTGDKLKAGDRVYSDFLVTYGYQDKQLNALGNSANVTTGLVVEQVAELDKDQYGDYKTKSQSEYHEATCYGSSETAAKTQVVNFVKTGAAAGVPVKDEITSKFIANQTVQLKNLDNKNQAKYSLNLLNKAYGTNTPSDKYKIYVFRAYSYIKVSDNVVVSDPTYFTIYDIASIEP